MINFQGLSIVMERWSVLNFTLNSSLKHLRLICSQTNIKLEHSTTRVQIIKTDTIIWEMCPCWGILGILWKKNENVNIPVGRKYFLNQRPRLLFNSNAILDQEWNLSPRCHTCLCCCYYCTRWKSSWDAVSNMHHETKKFNFDAQSVAVAPVER